jgi:hypothetical protein
MNLRLKRGDIKIGTTDVFWAYKSGREYWLTAEKFQTKTAKTKASDKIWKASESGKISIKTAAEKYNNSNKGKTAQKMHNESEKAKASRIRYQQSEKGRTHRKNWQIEKLQTDPYYRFCHNLRVRMRKAIKNGFGIKSTHTQELLGASFHIVHNHLTNLLKPGMTWENYGYETWHIDHIKACEDFGLTDPKQQRQCFHYTNLQPLWIDEHKAKHAIRA